ncbi:hypothetical protein HOLleu_18427 [Holothuria leucospilota]|uniref:Uncharacterized protein n=1 Tax=Holothuria leucospilota TaxID=206669 RepID=A0A9Q1C1S6_HOLLE|nr:hypothetical protein HOLleu_18427 [Holothuria leucospilota]
MDRRQTVDQSTNSQGQWPDFIWFLMKMSGLFYHGTVVTKRRCTRCEIDKYEGNDGIGATQRVVANGTNEEVDPMSHFEMDMVPQEPHLPPFERQDRPCQACETCWWDRQGNVAIYSDKTIGLKRWNHAGSWLISLSILYTTILLIIFEIVNIISKIFAMDQLLLHLLNYFAFVGPLSVFPVMNICSKVKSALWGKGIGLWATAMNARFVVQRFQFLDLAKQGIPNKPFLAICLMWPLFCSTYRAIIKIYLECHYEIVLILRCLTVVICELIWGCFVYIIYLTRASFQIQFTLLLDFVKKHEGDFNLCHNIIRRFTIEFRCFRNCVSVYMAAMIPICVLGASTTATWQYFLYDAFKNNHNESNDEFERSFDVNVNINIMIWSEVAMFSFLGPLAVGGLDVVYIWENFRINLIFMQNNQHRRFWRKMLLFLEYVEEQTPFISFTTVLSILSLYLGFQFESQSVLF